MKRTLSMIIAVVLTMVFSVSTFAISISNSFKGPLTELDEDEYIFSFGKTETDEALTEIGFKVGGRKYTLNDAALFRANQSGAFAIGFKDDENILGDSYEVVPYYVNEAGVETTGAPHVVNKADYADVEAGVKLSQILVDGEPISYFKETVKAYDYGIAYEDMEINNPTVTATAKEETSEVSYETFATGVNITVTSANGETDTYTVNFKPESAETTAKVAKWMGSRRRDADNSKLVEIDKSSSATTINLNNNGTKLGSYAEGVNRYGNIVYINFDISENINLEEQITFSTKIRLFNSLPEDLKIYAYEYNENVLPYYEDAVGKDYGYLGNVLNPEGWNAYSDTNGEYVQYSCDVTDYITRLKLLGKKEATIAIYYDSDFIASLWEGYQEGTFDGRNLSNSVVTNVTTVVNAQTGIFKDAYPKLTYSSFDNYTPKNLAILSDIKVDGETIEGFSEDILTYSLGVTDAVNLPEVTATAKYQGATIEINTVGTAKEITVTYGGKTKVYTVNFGLLTEVKKSSSAHYYKVLKNSTYNTIELDETDSTVNGKAQIKASADASIASNINSNIVMFDFDIGNDAIDTTKGVKLTIRVKGSFTDYPSDLKICAYEYDETNSIKRLGESDLSYMGELADSVAVSEGTTISAGYADFTFDLSSYVAKVQDTEDTLKVIFAFDYDQIDQLKADYSAGNISITQPKFYMTIYPNTQYMQTTTSATFKGGEPRLVYYKIGE